MVNPVDNTPLPPFQPEKSVDNLVPLIQQMQTQVLVLVQQLQNILKDPSLAAHPRFLEEFSSNGQNLNRTIEQTGKLR